MAVTAELAEKASAKGYVKDVKAYDPQTGHTPFFE